MFTPDSDLASIEDYLLSRPEVTHVTTSVGGTPARYNLVRSIAEPTMSYGELIVDYTTPEELKAALKLLDSGMEEICDQTRDQTVANVEQILQELRALNPDAQIILVGYYNPLPFLPTYGRHFRLLNRSVKALAQQYGADYVSIPYTSIANDGHPTVCGHKYIARQILKTVRK